MAKKRLGANPLDHLISSRPPNRARKDDGQNEASSSEATESPVSREAMKTGSTHPESRTAAQSGAEPLRMGGREATGQRPPSEPSPADRFVRKTVHLREDYVRQMKQIAALEDRSIKAIYDDALAAYLASKRRLVERHNL
jgi:hypothetical protein